jgi:N-acetylglucosamine-6-phosphate deacetylase
VHVLIDKTAPTAVALANASVKKGALATLRFGLADNLSPTCAVKLQVTGSIRVGKFADLIVLDQNLFKIPPSQIRNTKVLMTMVGGKVVWEDPTF